MKPYFIHLHVHSDYSMIDSLIKIDTLIKKTVSLQMPAIAITDFTNLSGLIKFYKSAYSFGIKPIIGVDFLMQNNTNNKEMVGLTILALNNIGYKNLILLISKAYRRGYNFIGPFIDREWLIEYNTGLILLSGARNGDIGKHILRGNILKIKQCLLFYKKYFPDRYYIELVRTGRSEEEEYLQAAVELAKKTEIPIVATNDVRFINSDDFYAHEIRVAIHNGTTINNTNLKLYNYSSQQYMRSEEEMCELFSDLPEALANSVEIARRCNVTIFFDKHFLPKFSIDNISIEKYFVNCVHEGLEERLLFLFPDTNERKEKRLVYDERLKDELQVINKMGFFSYFLIVMEFIQWSKQYKIPVGPGRGSGSGSLVAYVLKITDIDPIFFGLLFERFLNLERISMPDFDIDFCIEKRDLVLKHVTEIYGCDAVSQIVTFGTMAAKAAIRDVGRVLEYPYSFVNRISKLVPSDIGITLEKALTIEPELQSIYNSDEEVKTLINMARKLEGLTRNIGTHAGGVVISPTKITDFSPLYCDNTGKHLVTQFDKTDIEHIGLVKFDFLGLRTLTIIDYAIKMINFRRLKQKLNTIDISMIPLNDKKSFDLLQRSETVAIFQLESRGMKDLIKRLQPDCFEDIIALVALYRPGPLKSGMVDNFINRKHGREIISYPDVQWQHKILKPILKSTYGIILYQEQVMQIAQVLAHYSLGEADVLRCAMAEKNLKEMSKQRVIFKRGAESIGIDKTLSMKIFNILEKFASYGFNKSHSTAYAFLTYQTLWLKSNYSAEFMASVMTADMDNTDKIALLVDECLRMGIHVLSPNINNSQYYFNVNQNREIVYGIGAIKGVGKGTIKTIIDVRNNFGLFLDLFDFCIRIDIKIFNRRMLEKFIMSGVFDCFDIHRAGLMYSLDDVLMRANRYIKDKLIGQKDMFSTLIPKEQEEKKIFYNNIPTWSDHVTLSKEREALGFYLSGHPITCYKQEIKHYTGKTKLKDINSVNPGKKATIIGLVLSVRMVITKSNSRICICTLDDHSGQLDIILYDSLLRRYRYLLKKDRILIVQGQVSFNNVSSNLKLIVSKIIDFSELRKKKTKM